nr:hypothetical protein [Abalone asfa-like virus]
MASFLYELEGILYDRPDKEELAKFLYHECLNYSVKVVQEDRIPAFLKVEDTDDIKSKVGLVFQKLGYLIKYFTFMPILDNKDSQFRAEFYVKKEITTDFLSFYATSLDYYPHRYTIRKKIIDYLTKSKMFDKNLIYIYAVDIEISCFDATITFCKDNNTKYQRLWTSGPFIAMYSLKCGEVLNALDPNSLTSKKWGLYTLEKLKEGELQPKIFGKLTSDQLNPNIAKKEKTEIQVRTEQKISVKTSQLYKCPVCKMRETTYYSQQLRSLDEPATIMCTCLNCGHRFTGH